jgi:HK97 gp10 family phage protein
MSTAPDYKVQQQLKRLGLVPQAIRKPVADLIASRAQAIAAVDTGYMRDHIAADADGKAITSEAGYSGFVEFGTVHMSAQPFMRPAADTLSIKDVAKVANAEIKRRIRGG